LIILNIELEAQLKCSGIAREEVAKHPEIILDILRFQDYYVQKRSTYKPPSTPDTEGYQLELNLLRKFLTKSLKNH
jgi:hypothetical protein